MKRYIIYLPVLICFLSSNAQETFEVRLVASDSPPPTIDGVINFMRKLLACLLALLILNDLYAQKKQHQNVIFYKVLDYLMDTDIVYTDRVTLDAKVGLKINNVNKRLVVINKTVQTVTYNSETPKIFETFSKASLPDATPPTSAVAEGVQSLFRQDDITAANLPDSVKQKLLSLDDLYFKTLRKINDLGNNVNKYRSDYLDIIALLEYHTELQLLQDVCNISFQNLLANVDNTTRLALLKREDIDQLDKAALMRGSTYIQNKTIVNSYITKVVDDAASNYKEIENNLSPSKKNEITKALSDLKSKSKQLFLSLAGTKKLGIELSRIILQLKEIHFKFDLEDLYDDLTYRISKTDFTQLQKNIEEFSTSGKKDLFATYDYFNESNYTYYVAPQSIDNDLTVISVDIHPKDNVPCSPLPRTYELRVRPKGGVKIDFSSGLFLNFGGNDFRDQTYRYDSVPGKPNQSVIVKNKSKNAIFPSLGALMHIYPRNGNDVHFAGCFGLSIKDLEKINYHLGGSLIFGYSQRFILNAGATLTRATLIEDKYKVGQLVITQSAPQTIPTATFSRFGFFLSFTYNLSK